MTRAASIKKLCELKDVTPELARLIRQAWLSNTPMADLDTLPHWPQTRAWMASLYNPPTKRELRRQMVNETFGTYGVEFLGISKKTRGSVYYCNAGDPYAGTILFSGGTMFIGCWADLIENNSVRPLQ